MRNGLWFALTLSVLACTNSKKESEAGTTALRPKFEHAIWLIGSWYNETRDAKSYEVWKQINDTTFAGQSYSIRGVDTLSFEDITLVSSGNEMAYIPTVSGQNMGLSIKFALTFIDENKMIFENPRHDFPQMITYQQVSADSMVAEISGVIKGERQTTRFPMRRLD
jgi:hypothetical protein